MSRLALIAALEAIEAGDTEHATGILLAELEDDDAGSRDRNRVRCACGATFEWPGQRDDHQLSGACPLRRAA
jgi:hypothetical protein